jgi:hypothetical protein
MKINFFLYNLKMDTLTKFAIVAVVFYFLFMRKEGFALAEGVLTNKTQLDPTFFYKKGISR